MVGSVHTLTHTHKLVSSILNNVTMLLPKKKNILWDISNAIPQPKGEKINILSFLQEGEEVIATSRGAKDQGMYT